MMKKIFLFIGLCLLFTCNKDKNTLPEQFDNLQDYIGNNSDFPLIRDSLIACALGGAANILATESHPISILFYPDGNATEFLYFESDDVNINPDELSGYKRMDLTDAPIFNGYLRRFERTALDKNTWGRVTYVKDGKLHISNAIRIKYNDLPTEYNSDLLTLDQSEKLSPLFTWQDGQIEGNAIYFHVILNADGDLLSGTYTFDRRFQFYELSNVVLNIRDISPPPTLESDSDYYFLMMGVSADNWVNLIVDQAFSTN